MSCNITVVPAITDGLKQFCVQMASPSEAKRQRNTVDYDNVILALPARFPSLRKKKATHVDGKKGATTSEKTPIG